MSQQPSEPANRGKLVSTKHRDLHAIAEICDLLEALPASDRVRVLRSVNEKFPQPEPAKEPS